MARWASEVQEGDPHVTLRLSTTILSLHHASVLHNPVADEECWIVLVETVTTKHTGDVETLLTRSIEQQLA